MFYNFDRSIIQRDWSIACKVVAGQLAGFAWRGAPRCSSAALPHASRRKRCPFVHLEAMQAWRARHGAALAALAALGVAIESSAHAVHTVVSICRTAFRFRTPCDSEVYELWFNNGCPHTG